MKIEEEIKLYGGLMAAEKLTEALQKAISYCSEDIISMLPSIIMGSDGPLLESMVLITKSFLCEVKLGTENLTFDYVDAKTVCRHQVIFSELTVTQADDAKVEYQVANVEIAHEICGGLKTRLNYVGDKRDDWMKKVLESIPLSLLVK